MRMENTLGQIITLMDVTNETLKITIREEAVKGHFRVIGYFNMSGSKIWTWHHIHEWLRLPESTLSELAIICYELNLITKGKQI